MRVAFAYHPWNIRWNHGSAVLSALCQDAGIETEIIPLHPGFTGEGFDWVVCSFVTIHDYQAAIPYLPSIVAPKLAGGIYARKGGDIQGFTHVCRGEGAKLVDFFLTGDTAVFDTPQIDADISGFPDYAGVQGNEFGRGMPFFVGKKMIPYSHSRGCPHKCSFCETKNFPQVVRVKKNIRDDLLRLEAMYKPDLFYFTDETLPYYRAEWREQVWTNHTPFLSFLRADIEPAQLDFLIAIGLHSCAIGIESGDETYRNAVLNKNVMDRQIERTIAKLDKNGINRIMLYMRNTPGETDEMKDKTFSAIERWGGYPMLFEYEVL